MKRGEGSLFQATRVGIAVAEVPVRAAGPPAPTWWAHHSAVAWTAAWVKLRGHDLIGPRELLERDAWSGEIRWWDHSGYKKAKHRPDLVVRRSYGGQVAIEVELTKKSAERLRSILWRHAAWRSSGQSGGVCYVCPNEEGCDRVKNNAAQAGLLTGGGLHFELLDLIKAQAFAGYEATRVRPSVQGFRRGAGPCSGLMAATQALKPGPPWPIFSASIGASRGGGVRLDARGRLSVVVGLLLPRASSLTPPPDRRPILYP
jgi:hypothetical protein